MADFDIKQAEFTTSAGLGSGYPAKLDAEIAMVGKSNVGKSSLINSLCNNYKLARTSQQPGKTRLINFFLINKSFYLVDLPGYGFAKASKTEQESWGRLLEEYLSSKRLDHIFMLLDIRHSPTAEDRQMFEWIIYYGVPYTLVATKADKLPKSKRAQSAVLRARELGAPPSAFAYSAESREGRDALMKHLGNVCTDILELNKNNT